MSRIVTTRYGPHACENCGGAVELDREGYSRFCVNCTIKAMKAPTDIVMGTLTPLIGRTCGMCDNKYYRYKGHLFCLNCVIRFATRKDMEVLRLLINPWDRFQRILPMLSYAHAMRGINKDRVLLYYAYMSSYNQKQSRRVLEENVTYRGALDWRVLLRYQLGDKDRVIVQNWRQLMGLDLDSYSGINRADRYLTVKNWKIFKDIYPDPLYNPTTDLDESVTYQDNVNGVCQAILIEERWDDIPILADAMEEAGCNCDAILNHMRSPHNHTKYCWALWEVWCKGPNPPKPKEYRINQPHIQEAFGRATTRLQRAANELNRLYEEIDMPQRLPDVQLENMATEDVEQWGRDMAEDPGEPGMMYRDPEVDTPVGQELDQGTGPYDNWED